MRLNYVISVLCSLFFLSALCGEKETAELSKEKPIRPALVVVDLQQGYKKYISERDLSNNLTYVNYALEIFHGKNLPVFIIRHHDSYRGPHPDDEGFEVIEGLDVQEGDIHVTKHFTDSFKDTELAGMLKDKGVNVIFIAGFAADGCAIATYHGAQNHGFTPFLIRDALFSSDPEVTRSIQNIFDSVPIMAVYLMTR